MDCEKVKPLLSEFADEQLDASTAWQVQTHLSDCHECSKISRELTSLKKMLQTLPSVGPSARFDDALAQRLALTRRPTAQSQPWHTKVAHSFSIKKTVPKFRLTALRPAIALGLAAAAVAFAAFHPIQSVQPVTPAAVRSVDPAFVADCVAQHHRDASAEPLADMSAQTLAGSLDGSTSPDPSNDSSLF